MAQLAKQIVDDLWLKNRNFCSTDYDACLDYFNRILPFNVHEYRCETNENGWVIPPKWDLESATVSYNGTVIYSAHNPLQVIGLSSPFRGVVSLDELKRHLHTDKRFADAVPYHFRQNYRPWERDWGFCVPQTFVDSLQPGDYTVEIETKEAPGSLKVAEYVKTGSTPYGFAFVAHLDHAGMANDDLAGVAVGVEFFSRLSAATTKFTYRLVLVQEIIGSHFYLKHNRGPHILESCFLEMLGSRTPLALQATYAGQSYLELVMENVLQTANIAHRTGKFREIICNDEVMWESVGIPMASLSRFPYPEYHSDKDNPAIIDTASLEEAIQVLEQVVAKLEASTLIHKRFEGVIALSHPDYDLYVDPGQPAFNIIASDSQKKLRQVMDQLPLIPTWLFADQLARQVDIAVTDMLPYLRKWEAKGLLELI